MSQSTITTLNSQTLVNNRLELIGCGGYTEYGRNCSVIKMGQEFIVCDLGSGLLAYHNHMTEIYPTVEVIQKLMVEGCRLVGVCISHAHLDHWGAIGQVLQEHTIPVYCTRFNYEFHKHRISRYNLDLRVVGFRQPEALSSTFSIEFYPVQHSTPESSAIVCSVNDKKIVYLSDFKVDVLPTIEEPCTMKTLAEVEIDYLIIDVTSVNKPMCHSESVAHHKLRDVMHYSHEFNDLLIISTFSSQIARLGSILKIAEELGRTVLATNTYHRAIMAGVRAGILTQSTAHLRKMKLSDAAAEASTDRSKYIILCSGHQFEPNNGIEELISGGIYTWTGDEAVIKSARLISSHLYSMTRTKYEDFMRLHCITNYDDIHESGHAGLRQHRHVLKRLAPRHVIPTHASLPNFAVYTDMATTLGYKLGETCHIIPNLRRLILS